jgi:hypothetical protein
VFGGSGRQLILGLLPIFQKNRCCFHIPLACPKIISIAHFCEQLCKERKLPMPSPAEEFITEYSTTFGSANRASEVEIDLSSRYYGDADVYIEAVWSHGERRAGYAGKALRQLCDLADQRSITLHGNIHPLAYGELEGEAPEQAAQCERLDAQAMNNEQLEAWYGRHGFRRKEGADPWNPDIVRDPAPAPSLSRKSSLSLG